MPKIISEYCELVKSCHINCSNPDFFETHRESLQQTAAVLRYITARLIHYVNALRPASVSEAALFLKRLQLSFKEDKECRVRYGK